MLLPAIKLRKEAVEVALASSNRALQARLRAGFKSDKRFAFYALDCSLSQFVSQFTAGSGPAVLIADLEDNLAGAAALIEELGHRRFDGAIVAVSDNLDEASVRGLLRSPTSDWLPLDSSVDDLIDACERALQAKRRPDRSVQSKCIAFLPAAGGVGNTTLAIQAGFLLAQRNRNHDATCLVDLNFQSGALADYLDLRPGLNLLAMSDAPERLDNQLLEVMLARHSSGLAVLAAPRTPTECPAIDARLIGKMLSVASENFDTLVIDLPPLWMPWTRDVLAGCDKAYVVTEFTVPALRKAHEIAAALRAEAGERASAAVIVNKWRRQLFSTGLRKRDAMELLGESLAGFLPENYALVHEAIDRGLPLNAARRSNRVDRELARILEIR